MKEREREGEVGERKEEAIINFDLVSLLIVSQIGCAEDEQCSM